MSGLDDVDDWCNPSGAEDDCWNDEEVCERKGECVIPQSRGGEKNGGETLVHDMRNDANDLENSLLEKEEDGYVRHVLRVSHLDKFKLPENYPQSIADIIRSLTLDDSLLDTLKPKLSQTLRIRYYWVVQYGVIWMCIYCIGATPKSNNIYL